MATWLEKQRDKARREAENTRLTKLAVGLDIPSGNPFGRWAQGVAQRTMHPLEALAGAAQQAISDPTATALDWSNPIGGSLSGLVGMFAGKGAKTANLAALVKAEKMAKKGVPDELIWKKTGWTLDTPDKVPRFEVSDHGATVTPFDKLKSWGSAEDLRRGNSTTGSVGDFMQHQELGKNYDGLIDFGNSDKRITMRVIPGKQGASFNEGEMTSFGKTGQDITIGTEGNVINQSNALHELQHAIQQREGFARGGSPDAILAELEKTSPELYANYERTGELGKLGFNRYQRLAGEAEARLTQARMNMTPEQRLAQYPYQPDYFQKETGVPLKDLIVRKDGGTAMSAPQYKGFEIVEEGKQFPVGQSAIRLKDGTVLTDNSPIHALQIKKLQDQGIPTSEIESGGFIRDDGSYIAGSADTPRIIEQDRAKRAVAERRAQRLAPPKTEFELAHEVAQRNAAQDQYQ